MNTFQAPHIEYFTVSPILIVLGVAILGVLVEAFVPRARRYLVQVVLALVGLVAAFVTTVIVFSRLDPGRGQAQGGQGRRDGGAGRRRPGAVLLAARPGARPAERAALRRAAPRGWRHDLRRTGRGAAGHRGGARGLHQGPRAHRGLPADDVRGRRHADVPRGQRPADDVRRARGALAAALPALRPGPAPAPAQPGSGDEVLPARRLQLRLLRLRHRPGLRVRRLDGLRGDRRGRQRPDRQRRRCCSAASPCWPSACCSRSAPCRSTRGRPTSTRARPPR